MCPSLLPKWQMLVIQYLTWLLYVFLGQCIYDNLQRNLDTILLVSFQSCKSTCITKCDQKELLPRTTKTVLWDSKLCITVCLGSVLNRIAQNLLFFLTRVGQERCFANFPPQSDWLCIVMQRTMCSVHQSNNLSCNFAAILNEWKRNHG